MIRLTLALALVVATPGYAEADLGTALKPLWDFLDMVDRTWLKSALYERPALSEYPWSRPKTVLYDEPGGILLEHVNRWIALARSGDDVEIRGPCTSACTMIMAYVPKERLCLGDYASLQFHLVRFADTGKMDLASSLWMLNRYPGNIRDWLMARGGVASMSIQDLWTLEAEELCRVYPCRSLHCSNTGPNGKQPKKSKYESASIGANEMKKPKKLIAGGLKAGRFGRRLSNRAKQ
jgi:hypothetical protein